MCEWNRKPWLHTDSTISLPPSVSLTNATRDLIPFVAQREGIHHPPARRLANRSETVSDQLLCSLVGKIQSATVVASCKTYYYPDDWYLLVEASLVHASATAKVEVEDRYIMNRLPLLLQRLLASSSFTSHYYYYLLRRLYSTPIFLSHSNLFASPHLPTSHDTQATIDRPSRIPKSIPSFPCRIVARISEISPEQPRRAETGPRRLGST